MQTQPAHVRLGFPLLFVVLYGSGFVGAKLGLPHARPFEFLAWRFGIGAGVLAGIAWALRAAWPRSLAETFHIAVAGLLMIGVFSAGVFYSLDRGVSPAISALIIALQPILVGLGAGVLLGERTSARQWLGLLLGLVGVFLVLSKRLFAGASYVDGVLFSVAGLAGLAAGNLYQKKFCANMNVFTGGALQCASCLLAMLLGVAVVGYEPVQWTGEFTVALIWMTLIVSVGAVSILYVMIRHGQVSRVAGIFYLVPVSAAVTAYILFGEVLDAPGMIGTVVAGVGVALAIAPRRA